MNKTRRGLELGAAITGIVYNAISACILLLGLVIFGSFADLPVEDEAFLILNAAGGVFIAIILLMILYVTASIVIGALLCKQPKPNAEGKYPRRLGLGISFTILNGLTAIFMILSMEWLWFVVGAAITALEIAALCLNPGEAKPAEPDKKVSGTNEKIAEIARMKNAGFINEEQYKSAMEKVMATAAADVDNMTFDEKLAEIKRLKDLGVYDDEQYKQAIDDLINKNS